MGTQTQGQFKEHLAACVSKPIKPQQLQKVLMGVLAHQAPPTQRAKPAGPETPPIAQRSLRILLAEDNPINQKVALQQLRHLGCRADVAADGREVLQALDRQRYDIVLMDVQMPEMSGLEATREIRLRYPANEQPHIVAMTAHAMRGDRELCLEAGMDDYIAKPIRIPDLTKALDGYTVERQAAAAAPAGPPTEAPVLSPERLAELECLGGDGVDCLAETISAFLESAPRYLALALEAADRADASGLRGAVHKLKGSSGIFGAPRLLEICGRIEGLCQQGQIDAARGLAEQVAAEFARLEAALEAVLAGRGKRAGLDLPSQ